MAFIYRNALLPAVSMWNSFSSIYQRFTKAWNHNGTVYDKKLYYYRSKEFIDTKQLKRFLKSLGIVWEEFLEQEIDGEIDDIWFFIEPKYEWDGSHAGDTRIGSTSSTTQLVGPNASEIVSKFNEAFEIGQEITVTVDYGGANKRYVSGHETSWSINEAGVIVAEPLDTVAIRATLDSNPWYYFANSTHLDYTKDSNQFQTVNTTYQDMDYGDVYNPSSRMLGTTQVSSTVHALGIFALMGSPAFIKEGEVFDEKQITSDGQLGGQAAKYTYSQKYIYKGLVEDTKLVSDIGAWFEGRKKLTIAHRPVFRAVGEYRADVNYHTKDTSYKKALEGMELYLDPDTGEATTNVSNSLFSNGQLRVEPARLMRRRHFVEMIATSLETDYEVEEASTFEKILAVVIIIAAIVIGIMSAGTMFGPAGIAWSAVATAAGTASVILAVGMYVLSMVGGLSAQGLVKMIGAFAQIVGIIAMAAGIMTAIQNAGKILAQTTAKEAGLTLGTDAATEFIKNEMLQQTLLDQVSALVDQTIDAVVDKVTQFVSADLGKQVSTIVDGLDFVNQGMEFYQDKEREELEKELELAEEEAEAAELENLSNCLKHPGVIYQLMNDEIHSPDMLSKLDRKIQGTVGKDKSFSMWNSNVNSV